MVSQNLTLTPDWQQQADQFMFSGNYTQAAQLYEQAITAEPEIKSYYWHLGLILLLEGQETEAQTTWLLAMAEGESEEIDLWTIELMEVLQAEAERRELELSDYSVAWAIRQHLREINPTEVNNLLHLIELSILLGTYTGDELTDLGVIELLKSEPVRSVDSDRLVQLWKQILYIAPFHRSSLDLTEACLAYVKEPLLFLDNLIEFIYKISYSAKRFTLGVRFTELGLRLVPEHPELLRTLSCLYQDIHDYERGIETAKLCYSLMDNLADKIYANHLIMRGLMSAGGYWDEFTSVIERHKLLLGDLSKEQPTYLDSSATIRLLSSSFFFPYFQDEPKENVKIRSQVAQLCQLNVENYAKAKVEQYRQRHSSILKRGSSNKRLKIGYISYCLRTHSVGSLARWLFQYHNHDRFEIHAYFLAAEHTCDPLQDWYISKVDRAYKLGLDGAGTAQRIYEDEIDILIELDSLTLNNTCEIMAMKPAPIQATWLGWDASGVPAVDYIHCRPLCIARISSGILYGKNLAFATNLHSSRWF